MMTSPHQTSTPLPQLIYPRVIKLRDRIEQLVHIKKCSLPVEVGPITIAKTHLSLNCFTTLQEAKEESYPYEPIFPGEIFSPRYDDGPCKEFPWTNRWFRVKIPAIMGKEVEKEMDKRYLHFVAHGEFTLYWNDEPFTGVDPCHPRAVLPNEEGILYIDGGLWQTGYWSGLDPPDELGFRFFKCDLEIRNEQAFETFHDLCVLIEYIKYYMRQDGIPLKTRAGYYEPLDSVDPKLRKMLKQLNDACDVFDRFGINGLAPELKKIYSNFPADPSAMNIAFVGHSHIDLVYLWPERVTYHKAIHTFSTTLQLMKRYPEMIFSMSQPPLYYHIQNYEPQQAQKIKDRIHEHQWEFTGALEVEPDLQIPVGEGLARCIIYGQERIQSIRGDPSTIIWLPDVFGYPQCLPQLFKLAGVSNFFTTKILWSAVTKFPHNSFLWKSPDGSEVLAHLGVSGYACEIKIEEMMKAQRNYKQADVHNELLCASGYGDGGGGLTEAHCERARRLGNLAGVPKAHWSTAEDFFNRLNLLRDELPRYRGELFLEYHRGVHTSQAEFKAKLRAYERALQTLEAILVMFRKDSLSFEHWERYLFCLFHDATPGSSINTVYKELNQEMSLKIKDLNDFSSECYEKGECGYVILNPLAWNRKVMIQLSSPARSLWQVTRGKDATIVPTQEFDGKWFASVNLRGISGEEFLYSPEPCSVKKEYIQATEHSGEYKLDNGILCAMFDSHGNLYELTIDGVEMKIEKPAVFCLHHDNPATYDAWDLDHHTVWMKDMIKSPLNLVIKTVGPVVAILEGSCGIGEQSSMVVRYILEAYSETLKVECDVDWKETNRALRYEVQTSYRGEYGRYGSPFGSTDRCQTFQREREEAQWEVPASRWASVLDGRNQGLSIITESKYGYRIKDGCIGISLLRAPTYPDPIADKGKHSIRFALSLHRDAFVESDCSLKGSTASKADDLYTEPILYDNRCSKDPPFYLSNLQSVVPSWVMPSRSKAQTDTYAYLVRLHEVAGSECKVILSKSVDDFISVSLVDLNEKELVVLNKNEGDGFYVIPVAAHKISTVKITISKSYGSE